MKDCVQQGSGIKLTDGRARILLSVLSELFGLYKYSRTPLIRNKWDVELYGYAENPDNWIFL